MCYFLCGMGRTDFQLKTLLQAGRDQNLRGGGWEWDGTSAGGSGNGFRSCGRQAGVGQKKNSHIESLAMDTDFSALKTFGSDRQIKEIFYLDKLQTNITVICCHV